MVEYGRICELAVQLTKALHEAEVFRNAADLFFGVLPEVCAVSFTHILNNETKTTTFTAGGLVHKDSSEHLPPSGTATAYVLTHLEPLCDLRLSDSGCDFSDWEVLREQQDARCVYTVPIANKARGIGAVTVASTSITALSRAGRETIDTVCFMVAPYMHIKDVRRDLQIAQTLLLDSLPPQVVSHMLERQTMGMIPVVLPSGSVQYPRSDDSATDDEDEAGARAKADRPQRSAR